MIALAEAPALPSPAALPGLLLAACPLARLAAALEAIGRLEAALPWARLSAARKRVHKAKAGAVVEEGGYERVVHVACAREMEER